MSDQKPVDYDVFLSLLMSDPGPGAREDTEATASPELAAMLDEFVADHGVDCVDRDGRTLLMNAVTRGRPDLVAGLIAFLLARGADPSVANDHGVAPQDLLG